MLLHLVDCRVTPLMLRPGNDNIEREYAAPAAFAGTTNESAGE
jgi:hypothetical protein